MKMDALKDILLELSRAAGVSGNEAEVIDAAVPYFEKYATRVERDRFGNLIAYKQGSGVEDERFSLVLAAHIDEIGAIVAKIEEGGFLRFAPVGGIDPRTLLGQPVVVNGRKRLKGLVGCTSPHLLTEKERLAELKTEDLYIDIGFTEKQALELVRVGDPVNFDRTPLVMEAGGSVAGKAMDNRAGVAAMIACAAELSAVRHFCDLYFVATLQEEVGVRGAITAAYGLVPDLAVVVEVTHGEAPGLSYPEAFELGKGPVIAVGPNIHPRMGERLQETAREYRFSFQLEAVPETTPTDAYAIQVSREGIPCALLSIPLRYMHSTVELLNLDDLKNTGRLLSLFAAGLDRPFVEGLRCI